MPSVTERRAAPAGLGARQAAVGVLRAVLRGGQPLDEALASGATGRALAALAPRDRAFARAIAATALRRKGQIEAVLGAFLERAPPPRAGPLPDILLAAACQLLFLDTPPHAAIGLAVEHCKQDPRARGFAKLANAVLRRVAREGAAIAAAQDAARLNTPDWLWERWCNAYGEAPARAIADAHLGEPPLDLTVKSDPHGWAARLGGVVLPTGTVRVHAKGRIDELAGFAVGAWWVQDAAAALPARLLGDMRGLRIADLCAAPGGKTAQLAHAGAAVTAVDASEARLARLCDNLARLGLRAEPIVADASAWTPPQPFDAVLLDAPCTATGTVRRHPDIPHSKGLSDLDALTRLQARLLGHAASLVKPGGMLVYCVCSLEPEECEDRISEFLDHAPAFRLDPIRAHEIAGQDCWLDAQGRLRTLPHFPVGPAAQPTGMDGFFAARLIRPRA